MDNKKKGISAIILFFFIILTMPAWAVTEQIGTVSFVCGVVTAGPERGELRFLAKGEPLYKGDVISTGAKSFTIIKMIDDSKITLRPTTVFALEDYNLEKGKENALLRLFKGGLRAVTGFISKRNPERGFNLHTPTAVCGVRGTEFDARLCTDDCGDEADNLKDREIEAPSPVIGRIFQLNGQLRARHEGAVERNLLKGGPVYEGDILEMGSPGFAVVVFRDDSRVTMLSGTIFNVEEYKFEPQKSKVFFRLIKGGMRIFTGLITRRDARAFKLKTPTAVMGVRGTGVDAVHRDDGTYFNVWEGSIEIMLDTEEMRGRLVLEEGRTAFWPAGATEPVLLPTIPVFMRDMDAPRPDMDVPTDQLFETEDMPHAPGLYVTVYEGHVNVRNNAGDIDIGGGEAAYVQAQDVMPVRLSLVPSFQQFDGFPRPQELDEEQQRVLELILDEFSGSVRDKEYECEIR